MPAESAIYWDSVDSQKSISGGSSGECSSGSASRHYVDPWDLENYAYLRRHSVAGTSQQPPRQRRPSQRLSRETPARSDYWCPSREPGYVAPGFMEELYHGPPRRTNNACHYRQQIYEDEAPDYVAPLPVYAPLSELRHGESIEDHRRVRRRCKSTSMRELQRSEYVDPRIPCRDAEFVSPQEKYMAGMVPPAHLDLNTYGHLKIDYTNSWNSLNRKISKS